MLVWDYNFETRQLILIIGGEEEEEKNLSSRALNWAKTIKKEINIIFMYLNWKLLKEEKKETRTYKTKALFIISILI